MIGTHGFTLPRTNMEPKHRLFLFLAETAFEGALFRSIFVLGRVLFIRDEAHGKAKACVAGSETRQS